MGTINKRGELQWQAKVRRKGFPTQSKTFMYREDAEKWMRATERELETSGFIDRREAERNSLAQILTRYKAEVTPGKKSAEIESIKIDMLVRDSALSGLKMTAVNSAAVAAWRDRRLKAVSGATVNREIDVLSAVLNHARREWGVHVDNPVPFVKRPDKSRARDRRLSAEEECYLLAALSEGDRKANGTFGRGARNPWLSPLVRLAVETAMRRGELLSLQWENVDLDRRTAHLPDTKNGDPRTVPLSSRAVAILVSLPIAQAEREEGDNGADDAGAVTTAPTADAEKRGPVFPTTAMALRKGFTRAVERARMQYLADCARDARRPEDGFLDDLHFHDTRHEAASRLAEKLSNVLELSAVTGHKDLRMLKRYYHPRAEDLAKKLD
jgi:integrase